MTGGDIGDAAELDALRREVGALRSRVAELQRAAARHQEDTDGISLPEREELLREAERIAHLGTWTWDLGSGRVSWSDELFRILGLEPGSVTPSVEAFFTAVHSDDRRRAQETAERALQDGVLPLLDCRVVRPDGTIRYTTHSNVMLFDAQGVTRRVVGGVLDRTESLAVESRLRRTLALLEEAQHFAQLGSWRYDPQTGELEWSIEFRRIAGIAPDAPATPALFLERIIPEDRDRFRLDPESLLSQPDVVQIDGRLRRPDGELRNIRLESFPVQGTEGRQELRGTILDTTDQLRMREELTHAQKMEAVGRLAGGIAHDFNNLLTVVMANLELLSDRLGEVPELADSTRALMSAASLTRRLLAFGRKAQLSLKWISPNELVHSTSALMLRLVGDEVRLETELAAALPQIHVDPLEIERALVNLVVNARDAMPAGGVVRICTRLHRTSEASWVELSVEDEGPGVDVADRARIFEPFYTTRSQTGGTGMGLATVLGTAEQHGGTVRVESRPGGGSIFTIALPVPAAAPKAVTASPALKTRGSATRPLEFLMIDDEPVIADVTRRLLETRGHVVHVATHPDEVLRVWSQRSASIDLVICDVVMRDMRGPHVIAMLGAHGPKPRVLFVTGYSDEGARAQLGHPVLAKPFTASALLQAIQDALG